MQLLVLSLNMHTSEYCEVILTYREILRNNVKTGSGQTVSVSYRLLWKDSVD